MSINILKMYFVDSDDDVIEDGTLFSDPHPTVTLVVANRSVHEGGRRSGWEVAQRGVHNLG